MRNNIDKFFYTNLEIFMNFAYFIFFIFAAVNSVLFIGLPDAHAQEQPPEIRKTVHCGGALIAIGVIRHRQTDDEIHFLHGALLAQAATSTVYKELHGRTPEGEELKILEAQIYDSAREFFARNNGFRSQVEYDKLYIEALNCYQSMLGLMSERGLEVLSKHEIIDVVVRAIQHQANYLTEYFSEQ